MLSNDTDADIYKRSKNELFILNGAEHSRYNAWHWFRYLRKIINTDGEILLNKNSIENLLNNSRLTNFQKVTLKRATEVGTPTYNYLRGLNQPCRKSMLEEFFRRNPDARKHRGDILKIK